MLPIDSALGVLLVCRTESSVSEQESKMAQIKVTPQELNEIKKAIYSHNTNAQNEIKNASGKVRNLVDQGWGGGASDQFRQIWKDWKTSSDKVQQAMTDMADYLGKAAEAYAKLDDDLAKGLKG